MTQPLPYARQSVLGALGADAAVVALIPADRHYPTKTPSRPVKPWLRSGVAEGETIQFGCWKGEAVHGSIHVFVGQTDTILDPETWCGEAVGAIKEAIELLPDCFVDRTTVIPDTAEPDVMHGIVFWRLDALQAT